MAQCYLFEGFKTDVLFQEVLFFVKYFESLENMFKNIINNLYQRHIGPQPSTGARKRRMKPFSPYIITAKLTIYKTGFKT